MTVKLWTNVPQQFLDNNGNPLAGGKLFTYTAGSSTKQTTYSESTGSSQNANPIVLDSAGRLTSEVWLTSGVNYKVILTASTDSDPPTSPLQTWDNLTGINDTTVTLDEWVAGPAPTYVSATQFTLVGDQTTTFQVGRRLKTTNSGGTVYSTITASAYTTLTTVTVVNDSSSLDSGLSAVSYALLNSSNPSIPVRGTITPSQITGSQNNYSPTGISSANVLRISTSARWNITGLTGGADGKILSVLNVGTFPAVFTYQDTSSTAANRFAFGCTLGGGQHMLIMYDATQARWVAVSIPEPVGTLKDFAGGTVPAGYLACDNSAVSRTTYAALFNEIGTTGGTGDGSTTFNVPDFRRRTAVGSGGSGTATLANTVGSTGGEETHTLTLAESPAHSHTASNTSSSGALGAGPAPAGSNNGGGATTSSATDSQGGGGAHNNMQPSAVVTKIIRYV